MDLTALILEVRGPSVVDLTELSLQPWLSEKLWPQPDLCLDVALESREVLWQRIWGSPLAKGLAFSKESSKRSYHPVLRNQTTENERSSHQPFKPKHVLKHYRLQKADVCSLLR